MSTHRRLNAEDERLGRYHGPARIVYMGDPVVCARYVTLGRNILAALRHSLALGGITEGMRAASFVGGSVLAMYKGGMNQIIINAAPGAVALGKPVAPVYQFVGSGPYLWNDTEDPEIPGRALPKAYAVAVRLSGAGTLTATPLYSNVEADTQVPERWVYVPQPYLSTDQPELYVTPAVQPDGMGVNQWFPDRYPYWLETTWGGSHPCHGLGGTSVASYWYYSVDQRFDFPPITFIRRKGKEYREDTDWWRSGGIQRVEALVDGVVQIKRFLIFVDVNSTFYARDLSDTTQPLQQQVPVWPSGLQPEEVGKDSGKTAGQYYRAIIPAWKFNSTGTRAVCVTAQREDPFADNAFTSSLYNNAGVFVRDIQHDAPALLEVNLVFDASFVFSVTIRQVLHSKTDLVLPVAADYVRSVLDVVQDSLALLCFEHYINPLAMASDDNGNYPYHPNKVTLALVKTQSPVATPWVTQRTFLAYYLSWDNSFNQTHEFSPTFQEILGQALSLASNDFCYITQICSLDLTTLSMVLCATAYTQASYILSGTATYSVVEAAYTDVIVGNQSVVDQQKTAGHPALVAVLPDMLHRTNNALPDLTAYSPLYAGATLDYQAGTPPYMTLVVHDGNGGSATTTNLLVPGQPLKDYGWGYLHFENCPLFADQDYVEGPQVYNFFDSSLPIVRPGMKFENSGSLVFTGYPVGLVHHETVHALVMAAQQQVMGRLRTHPNGSWSLCYGPIVANNQRMTYTRSGGWSIPESFDQIILDRIYWKTTKTPEEFFITTHREMLNQAFEKTWTEADYYLPLRIGISGLPEFNPQAASFGADEWFPFHNDAGVGVVFGPVSAAFSSQLFNEYSNVGIFYNRAAINGKSSLTGLAISGLFNTLPLPEHSAVFHAFPYPPQVTP